MTERLSLHFTSRPEHADPKVCHQAAVGAALPCTPEVRSKDRGRACVFVHQLGNLWVLSALGPL